ncbi:MAG: EAL domain-containing protein [Gaiellaceae bacterium]
MIDTASPQHRDLKLDDVRCLARLRVALRSGGLRLVAQPIVELATGEVVGHELLVRLAAPDWSLIGPDYFLAAAERTGLIREVDRWVLGRAAHLAGAGRRVHANVSGRSIAMPGLLGELERALDREGADPARLTLEITETAATEDLATAAAFAERFNAMGGRIALDDFGTGCGLMYVKQLPVDMLKIDVGFVYDLVSSRRSRAIVEAIAGLADEIGLVTVAEGVEDQPTRELLRTFGVNCAQGFHVGRAVPIEEPWRPGPGPCASSCVEVPQQGIAKEPVRGYGLRSEQGSS